MEKYDGWTEKALYYQVLTDKKGTGKGTDKGTCKGTTQECSDKRQ